MKITHSSAGAQTWSEVAVILRPASASPTGKKGGVITLAKLQSLIEAGSGTSVKRAEANGMKLIGRSRL